MTGAISPADEGSPLMNGEMKEKERRRKRTPGRRGSFTDAEAFFLRALLIDDLDDTEDEDGDESEHDSPSPKPSDNGGVAERSLSDDILLSVPPGLAKIVGFDADDSSSSRWSVNVGKPNRPSTLGLWKAHAVGVSPKVLARKGALSLKAPSQVPFADHSDSHSKKGDDDKDADNEDDDDEADVASDLASDQEVRKDSKDDLSEASSWGDEDHFDHFDTWEVLRDEYAGDFGFDFSGRNMSPHSLFDDEDDLQHPFLILGTSADDPSSQPHVLSPPLMDSLMTFLPDKIYGENFWMKFSLVRDGASLDTLKQYVRAAKYTILAIETPKGEVFGSFTSESWRNNHGFFGKTPAFVWKMRHSRQTKCYSLYDQAQLESEIDVFVDTERHHFVQVCRHNSLSVGGDDHPPAPPDSDYGDDDDDTNNNEESSRIVENQGFAIDLESHLLCGTTSPCSTFHSPSLCGRGDKTEFFEVAGLEVWTFTPCRDVDSAEKLEMTKYFIEQNTASRLSDSSFPSIASTSHRSTCTREVTTPERIQRKFYQRVGEDPDAESRRQRWQYMNMMNSTSARGLGATPRYGYNNS